MKNDLVRWGIEPGAEIRLLEDPGETEENLPEDVRIYAKYDDGALMLRQGEDLVVVHADDWERLAAEVAGLIIAQREEG